MERQNSLNNVWPPMANALSPLKFAIFVAIRGNQEPPIHLYVWQKGL